MKKLFTFLFLAAASSSAPLLSQNIQPSDTLAVMSLQSDDASDVPYPEIIPPSPNASSLGVYGDVPVGHYTGIPSISIPLYEVVSGRIKVPVTLSYHAGGIRVSQEASWAGLGWSLNAGGVISHSIFGTDDLNDGIYRQTTGYCASGKFPLHDEEGYFLDDDGEIIFGEPPYYEDYMKNYKDMKPDMFYYNFGEYSGQMAFPKKEYHTPYGTFPSPLLLNQDRIDVNYHRSGMYLTDAGDWTITTPDGTRYHFHTAELTKTYCDVWCPPVNPVEQQPEVLTAWYLDSITNPYGDKVEFIYEKHSKIRSQPAGTQNRGFGINWVHNYTWKYNNISYTQTVVEEILLKEIRFAGGTVLFATKDRDDLLFDGAKAPQALDYMVVKDNGGTILKKIEFTTDYYNNQSKDTLLRRLRLDGVKDDDGKEWTFAYDANPLPPKNSVEVDYWGYYNGKSRNRLYLPEPFAVPIPHFINPFMKDDILELKLGADRNASDIYAQSGILKRIKYPTGGYTDFMYELHTFDDNDYSFLGGDFKYAYDYYDRYVSEDSLLEQEFTVKEKLPCSAYVIVYYNGFKCTGNSGDSHPVIDYTYEDFTKDDVIYRLEKKKSDGSWYTLSHKTFANILCGEINSRGEARISLSSAFEPGEYRLTMPTYMNTKAGMDMVIPRIKSFDELKGGGLRVKSVENYDGNDHSETQYEYAHGKAHNFPRTVYIPGNLPSGSYGQYSSNVFALGANMSGISVAYDVVWKICKDNDSTVCRSSYTFHNRSEDFPKLSRTPGTPARCFMENGLPKEVEAYSGDGKLLQRTSYDYVQDENQRKILEGFNIVSLYNPGPQLVTLHTFYEYPSEWWYLDSKTTTDYFDNGSSSEYIKYVYDKEHHVVNTVITECNDGTELKDSLSYLYRKINDSIPYTVELLEKRSGYVDSVFAWGELRGYGSGIDLKEYSTEGIGQSGYEQRFSVVEYDDYHNPVYIIRNNTEHTVYIWGYNGMYPVAEISGATLDEVLTALGQPGNKKYLSVLASASKPDMLLIGMLRNKLPEAHIRQFAYKPLVGLEKSTDAAGKNMTYSYDSSGRLIKIVNQSYSVQAFDYQYFSQGNGENYIRTRTYSDDKAGKFFDDVTYYDGLGKASQQNMVQASPSGKDLVSAIGYDALGRNWREWLPVPIDASGQYVGIDEFERLSRGVSGYNDNYPYIEHLYEASELDRLKQEKGPGEQFQSPEAFSSFSYLMNGSSDSLSCLGFRLMENAAGIVCDGTAQPGKYQIMLTEGPDSSLIYEFKDSQDRTVLTRRKAGGLYADTYYVYDINSNLKYVLPPELSRNISGACSFEQSDILLDRYAYMYEYDARNRCISKKIPGAGWIYYGYDRADRLILSQDANMRDDGKWMVTLPDVFGRPVLQGVVSGLNISGDMFAGKSAFVEFDASATDNYCYRTECGFDLDLISVLKVNYYDDYLFVAALPDLFAGLGYKEETGYGVPYNTGKDRIKSKGLLTGCLMAEVPQSDVIYASVMYYDRFDRLVQTHRTNNTGVMSSLYSNYDFLGNVVASKEVETVYGVEHTFVTDLKYDGRGRLVEESSVLDGSANSRLSYVYDAFGRMKTMNYGENIVSSDIAYNIRNWMTEMTGDVFSMKLRYESPLYARPRFSGNIAELEWKSGADSVNIYAFDYDELSRVLGARRYFNGVANDSFTEKNISYDLNGNILSLQRVGDGRLIDDLKYTYSGNRLASIDDSGRIVRYGYDLNGNIVSDGYNGLQLSNNILNLTESVSDNSGLLVTYSYLPDGTKLSVLDSAGNGLLYLGSMIFAIKDGTVSLKSAGFSGGRFMPSGSFGEDDALGQFVPYYHIVDHLGSVRAVVDGSDGSVVERDDYYPFGQRWSSSWPAVSENRFHFNSKEDQSLFGTPYIDYGARQYDPAIARWNAVDPLSEKYYPVTPYAFCTDNPVNFVDPDGNKLYFANGVSEQFKRQFAATIKFMNSRSTAGDIAKLHASNKVYYIAEIADKSSKFAPSEMTIYWDASHIVKTKSGIWLSPATVLAHEADHAQRYDEAKGNIELSILLDADKEKDSDPEYGTKEERRVITGTEQYVARRHGEIDEDQFTRNNHEAKTVFIVNVMGVAPKDISEGVYNHNVSKRK